MTAEKQEREGVVLLGRRPGDAHVEHGLGLLPPPPGAFAPPAVDQAPGRDGDEPGSRVVGHALFGPLQRRGEERLLHRVLGRVELPVPAHQRAENLRRELAQQVLDAGILDRRHGGTASDR